MLHQVLFPSLNYSLRILEYPQWLSRFPSLQQFEAPGTWPTPASLRECPLCPKPRICLNMLEYPLSGSPSPPPPPCATPGNWSPIRGFCPYAHSIALKAWNPPQPPYFDPHPPGSCSGCGPLPLPLLAGLVAADAVVSLLIVVVVFICARPRDRPTQDGKVYINMPGRG
uniref:Hematopoietic cell signal transducer n=1 Tax=Pipistrellus kuhlii TaxID=59472 RepID=A0A7J7V074_PIPKU|nr:hematopoietic cell signal transducer [Pipistrellus kuhlii]